MQQSKCVKVYDAVMESVENGLEYETKNHKKALEWLLCVGGGNAPTNKAGSANEDNGQIVEVNPKFLMQSSGNHLHDIFEATSAENMLSKSIKESITKRAILTPGNETVDKINPYMLEKIKRIFISNLNEDSSRLFFPEAELACLPLEFLQSLDKTQNKEVKLTLESNHVEAILELCKIAKTRKTMDMAYGKRCEDANIPVLPRKTGDQVPGGHLFHFN
ncbi:hypothetical protein Bca4012_100012 [Brassica carinata]